MIGQATSIFLFLVGVILLGLTFVTSLAGFISVFSILDKWSSDKIEDSEAFKGTWHGLLLGFISLAIFSLALVLLLEPINSINIH